MSQTPKGLTLIELLISSLLISIMLGAIWMIFHTGYTVFYGQYARQNIKDQASYAFLTMTNELHQAPSVTAATATSVTFTADLNNDGVNETVQYTWSGTAGQPLNRVVGTQTTGLVRSANGGFNRRIQNASQLKKNVAPWPIQSFLLYAEMSTFRSGKIHFRRNIIPIPAKPATTATPAKVKP